MMTDMLTASQLEKAINRLNDERVRMVQEHRPPQEIDEITHRIATMRKRLEKVTHGK
jgi:hypothetical protein